VGLPTGGDPLHALRDTVAALRTPELPGLPPLTGGLVGYVAYDAVRRLERLPSLAVDDLHLPELGFLLATDLAVLDHQDGSVVLIANAVNWDDTDERVDQAYADAVTRLDRMTRDLGRPAPATVASYTAGVQPEFERRRTSEEYAEAVDRAKEEIKAGEAFQVVPSQRFEMTTSGQRAGRLPDAAGHQSQPVHVPPALRRLRHRRLQPRGPGQGHR
jgi:anthranilate synthase component 1